MEDLLICVDPLDVPVGTMGKEECHRRGLLHRAFSIFLYDGERVLLQRQIPLRRAVGQLLLFPSPGWGDAGRGGAAQAHG